MGGVPGNGKTTLIKEGISKALDKPFVFISLGGATDASFLEGHSYTYEGSIPGRIAEGIINAKCNNPIIYFDELDKVSKTHKGDEIYNLLVHLIDHSQNTNFRDKYFHGLKFDLSKVTFMFSYNNPSKVDPILRDRITEVQTKYLMISQKQHIAKHYLLPAILKNIGLEEDSVTISDELIRYLINNYTYEGGVRRLKEILTTIVRELNLYNLMKSKLIKNKISFPYKVRKKDVEIILKNLNKIDNVKVTNKPKIGIVNGLWANDLGIGGVLPIETLWYPSSNPLKIKATGCLEKVIKESTEVACSLAWNNLTQNEQTSLMAKLKDHPMGIHIHCPEGATPKDGPSAGAALTIAIYSLFTKEPLNNKIAMTGEINLQGKVMAIGGLEEKLEGAKRAGAELALVPKENKPQFDKIMERNKTLCSSKFKVELVETFQQVKSYFFNEDSSVLRR